MPKYRLRGCRSQLVALTSMSALGDMRNNPTPVPTPQGIRLLGSTLVGISVACLTGTLGFLLGLILALVAVGLTFLIVLKHPYRREMKRYAEAKNAITVPSISQIVPLFIWWLLLMLAPILMFPWWGVLVAWLVIFAVAYVLFPHVDGTRRLAFA